MTKPAPAKYQTANWKACNAALKARGSLTIWLDRDMGWHGAPSGNRRRTPTFSDAAIQFCLTIKCLFNLALRQTVGMVQSLLRLAGLNRPTPDFSTVCRRQKHLQVVIPYRPTTSGLHLLIDSTGIKMLGEGEWETGFVAQIGFRMQCPFPRADLGHAHRCRRAQRRKAIQDRSPHL